MTICNAQKGLDAELLLLDRCKDDRKALRKELSTTVWPELLATTGEGEGEGKGRGTEEEEAASMPPQWSKKETEKAVRAFQKDAEGTREGQVLATNLLRGAQTMAPDTIGAFSYFMYAMYQRSTKIILIKKIQSAFSR